MIWALLREKDKDFFCPGSRICNDDHYEHADDCPVTWLQDLMLSPNGLLLERALNLDFATERGLVRDWGEIPADEYFALRAFQQERNRHEHEQLEKSKPNGK